MPVDNNRPARMRDTSQTTPGAGGGSANVANRANGASGANGAQVTNGANGTNVAKVADVAGAKVADVVDAGGDRAAKRIGRSVDKRPVSTSATSSARAVQLAHVQGTRLSEPARRFLRMAYLELAKDTCNLGDARALLDLAKEHGVVDGMHALLHQYASKLGPELLAVAHVHVGGDELKALQALATHMGRREDFDVQLGTELTVARSWVRSDDELAAVDGLAHALGLDVRPAASKSEPVRKLVLEDTPALRKSLRLRAKNPIAYEGYQKVLELLARGEAGHNQHALSHDLAGLMAADLPGSGAGRGADRIIYELDGDRVIIRDIVDYH